MENCRCIQCKKAETLANEHNQHLNFIERQLRSALEVSQWATECLEALPAAEELGRRGKVA